jgi:hypothetical protein
LYDTLGIMFRIVLYAVLGFSMGLIFGPLVTISNVGVLSLALLGGLFGGALGISLNRILGEKEHGDFNNLLWWANRSAPWSFLPEAKRHKLLMQLRSKCAPYKEPRDPAFLESSTPPVVTGWW